MHVLIVTTTLDCYSLALIGVSIMVVAGYVEFFTNGNPAGAVIVGMSSLLILIFSKTQKFKQQGSLNESEEKSN